MACFQQSQTLESQLDNCLRERRVVLLSRTYDFFFLENAVRLNRHPVSV
jgi:hypothetical protein